MYWIVLMFWVSNINVCICIAAKRLLRTECSELLRGPLNPICVILKNFVNIYIAVQKLKFWRVLLWKENRIVKSNFNFALVCLLFHFQTVQKGIQWNEFFPFSAPHTFSPSFQNHCYFLLVYPSRYTVYIYLVCVFVCVCTCAVLSSHLPCFEQDLVLKFMPRFKLQNHVNGTRTL